MVLIYLIKYCDLLSVSKDFYNQGIQVWQDYLYLKPLLFYVPVKLERAVSNVLCESQIEFFMKSYFYQLSQ